MRRSYLLDSNHVGAAINPVSPLRDRLSQRHRKGYRFRTCVPVLFEVEVGIQDSNQTESFRRQLCHLLQFVKTQPLDLSLAGAYGEVFREMRSAGRVLSQVDMILAAMARELNYTLLTTDRDFEA